MFRNYMSMANNNHTVKYRNGKNSFSSRLSKIKMEYEFVQIDNISIRVDSYGGYLPSKILDKSQEKPNELILMIPGNPGITTFYRKFLNHLHSKTKKPIWILSHGGHDKENKNISSFKYNKNLYKLKGQIEQKNKFINTYLEGVRLYCIGHSIGCKMILDILNEKRNDNFVFEKCIMLFPTIERMAETPNGKIVSFVNKYIIWLILFGSWIFTFCPAILQFYLLRLYCYITAIPPYNIPPMLNLIDPYVLNNVFYLADDEMKKVKELDDKIIKEHGCKMHLYYGASDGWTPLKYFTELTIKHENVKAEVCTHGYQHAFVLKDSEPVADLVQSWLGF